MNTLLLAGSGIVLPVVVIRAFAACKGCHDVRRLVDQRRSSGDGSERLHRVNQATLRCERQQIPACDGDCLALCCCHKMAASQAARCGNAFDASGANRELPTK